MKKVGLVITYLILILLVFFLALDFSHGDSLYCGVHEQRYALLGFSCSNHVNSFLFAFLANPGTYFFTISLLFILILFFKHTPYIKPEYWVRITDNPSKWVVKKMFSTALEMAILFYLVFASIGFLFGFTFEFEFRLLLPLIYLLIFTFTVVVKFHMIYVFTGKYIVALFSFFFINFIFFTVIDEVTFRNSLGQGVSVGNTIFQNFENHVVTNAVITYVCVMLIICFITLIIALRRKECYK